MNTAVATKMPACSPVMSDAGRNGASSGANNSGRELAKKNSEQRPEIEQQLQAGRARAAAGLRWRLVRRRERGPVEQQLQAGVIWLACASVSFINPRDRLGEILAANGARSSIPSPTPMKCTGSLYLAAIATRMPPRAVPSSLVITSPVTPAVLLEFLDLRQRVLPDGGIEHQQHRVRRRPRRASSSPAPSSRARPSAPPCSAGGRRCRPAARRSPRRSPPRARRRRARRRRRPARARAPVAPERPAQIFS